LVFQGKESASFLKKRSKKLLIPLGYRRATSTAPEETKVFCALFFKKAPLASPYMTKFPIIPMSPP
jgi:hypothetical protein